MEIEPRNAPEVFRRLEPVVIWSDKDKTRSDEGPKKIDWRSRCEEIRRRHGHMTIWTGRYLALRSSIKSWAREVPDMERSEMYVALLSSLAYRICICSLTSLGQCYRGRRILASSFANTIEGTFAHPIHFVTRSSRLYM